MDQEITGWRLERFYISIKGRGSLFNIVLVVPVFRMLTLLGALFLR